MGNWLALQSAWEHGRLGKTGPEGAADRPLMNGDDQLWEITAFGPDGVKMRRRDMHGEDGEPVDVSLDPNSFSFTGPWHIANNDTTAEIWKSKYAPLEDHGDQDPLGVKLDMDAKIEAKQQDVDDILALLGPDGGINVPGGDDGISDLAGAPESDAPSTATVFDETLNKKIEIPVDKLEAWALGTWTPPDPAAAEPTGGSQKIVHGVAAEFSPSEPILSTEMDLADLDAISAQLLNKHVITLPIEALDADWDATNLGTANGLGTVTSVETKKAWDYTSTPAKIVDEQDE